MRRSATEARYRVRPIFQLKRDGHDLHCRAPISFVKAALGGAIEVPTLDGKGKLKVPGGTQSGTTLRIKGKGMPKRAGIGRDPGKGLQLSTNLLLIRLEAQGGFEGGRRRSS